MQRYVSHCLAAVQAVCGICWQCVLGDEILRYCFLRLYNLRLEVLEVFSENCAAPSELRPKLNIRVGCFCNWSPRIFRFAVIFETHITRWGIQNRARGFKRAKCSLWSDVVRGAWCVLLGPKSCTVHAAHCRCCMHQKSMWSYGLLAQIRAFRTITERSAVTSRQSPCMCTAPCLRSAYLTGPNRHSSVLLPLTKTAEIVPGMLSAQALN